MRRAEVAVWPPAAQAPYQPIEGAANCRAAVQRLLFGDAHPAIAAGRIVTIQSIGSSGSLRIGAEFIHRWFVGPVWVSDPTWDNHRAMFEGAGFKVNTYPYYDAATGGVRFDAMLRRCARLRAASCCCTPAATTRPAST